jgi:uncharacterized membrane protein
MTNLLLNEKGEKMKNFLNRFKSWAVWLSIGALVVFCAKEFGGIDISGTVNGLLDVLLPLLVAFGIVNNPTDSKHF